MIAITFDFPDRREEDLQQLNRLLQVMEISYLDIEGLETYLATKSDADGKLLGRRCGLDSGTLKCRQAINQPGHHYRIDTYVTDDTVDYDTYLEDWRQQHPDRVMRISMFDAFNDVAAYTIIHHEKVVKDHDV